VCSSDLPSERYKSFWHTSVDPQKFEEYRKSRAWSMIATEMDHGKVHVIHAGVSPDGYRWTELPDPVGEVFEAAQMPNGLRLHKVRVPMGVLAVIYEARPNWSELEDGRFFDPDQKRIDACCREVYGIDGVVMHVHVAGDVVERVDRMCRTRATPRPAISCTKTSSAPSKRSTAMRAT
jgi:hypothetical protein